jgi:hypothetical protein
LVTTSGNGTQSQEKILNKVNIASLVTLLATILVIRDTIFNENNSYDKKFNFFNLGHMMAEQDGGELARVLAQERQLETGEREEGTVPSSSSTTAGGEEDERAADLRKRLQNYLAIHGRKKDPANSSSSSNCSDLNNDHNKQANSTYDAIGKLRQKNLEAQNLYGGVSTLSDCLGSFKPDGETWGSPPVSRQNFGARHNISLNFDPVTLQCKNCDREPHRILAGIGGGGDDTPGDRMLIVLADQSFPAAVGPEDGCDCMMVIRLEYGSPHELVEIFLDLTRGCRIPAGSVVLLSSLSHLADVGLAAYTADLNSAATKLTRALRGGVVVLPGFVFPAANINNAMVVRGMIDLLTWSAEASRVMDSVQPVLRESHLVNRDLLLKLGTGDAQSPYGVRLRLPVQLGSPELRKWELTGPENLKNGTGPVPSSDVMKIINSATSELAIGLGLNYYKVANLYGGQAAGSSIERNVVVIGASHASRLHVAFKNAGAKAKWLETRNWRPRTAAVDSLILEMDKAVAGLDNPVLVFTLLDNAYFQTGQVDGSIIPNSKDISGAYHVDGDLICGPAETAKKLFTQIVPALKKFPELDKIVLVPLPRYLWSACCGDVEHATNTRCDGYQEEQLGDLEACQRLWRGLAHRQGIPNLKICNTGRLLADSELWVNDPVHPCQEGYDRVVRYLIQGLADMANKRKKLSSDDSDLEDNMPQKKQKTEDGMERMPPPRFRPAWTSSTGNFVSPAPVKPFNTGRGRFMGRRFGRGGGRSPFY